MTDRQINSTIHTMANADLRTYKVIMKTAKGIKSRFMSGSSLNRWLKADPACVIDWEAV